MREFGKGVLEKIISGADLLQLLEERSWLSAERVERLSELLQTIGRHDLDNKVQMYADSAISRNLSNHGELALCDLYLFFDKLIIRYNVL